MDETKYREFEVVIEADYIKRGMSPSKAKWEAHEAMSQVKRTLERPPLTEKEEKEIERNRPFFEAQMKKQAEMFICPLCHRESAR